MKSRRSGTKQVVSHTSNLTASSTPNSAEGIEVDSVDTSEFPRVEIRNQCPVFLRIKDNNQVNLEDIDPLQLELETLLVAVVQRKQQIRAQLEALDHDDTVPITVAKGVPQRSEKQKAPVSPTMPGPGCKKARTGLSESSETPKTVKKPSLKPRGKKGTSQILDESQRAPEQAVQGGQKSGRCPAAVVPSATNDTSHRFWAFVDEYCKPPTEEQIRILESMLASQAGLRSSDYVKVPPLGTHYTVKWAKNDLLEEQREAAPDISSNELKEDMERILRQTAKESLHDERCGNLAHRLMSCLIDENITYRRENLPVVKKNSKMPASEIAGIEERIRKELEDLGVMQALAEKVAEQDDEVFLELRKCQSQLLSLASQNCSILRKIISSAWRRIAEAKLEAQQRSIDNEILEHYRKRKTSAQKKNAPPLLNPPSKKEREHLQSLLERREAVLAKMAEIGVEDEADHEVWNSQQAGPA